MAYLGKTPSQAVRQQYFYTATGGETSLSGADDNGNTLSYTDGNYVDVFLNGILLVTGTDYNTTTANTIGGLTALTASDVVEIVVYDVFSVFGGDVQGDLTISNGTLTSGDVDINGGTIDGTTIGGTTPAAGTFTDVVADDLSISGGSSNVSYSRNAAEFTGIELANTNSSAGSFSGVSFGTNGTGTQQWFVGRENQSTAALQFCPATAGTPNVTFEYGGNVGIGTSTDSGKLNVYQAGGETQLKLRADSTQSSAIYFTEATSGYRGFIAYDNVAEAMRFGTNSGGERMRIDSSGHLIAPNGVTLGTAVGTYSAANTLDDYEEGTLTISTLSVVTGLTGVSHNHGFYTKIGNWVHIQGGLNITCSGTGKKAFVMTMPISMHQNSNVGQLGTVAAYPYATNNASGYILDNTGSNAYDVYVEFNVSNSAQTGLLYQLSYRTA